MVTPLPYICVARIHYIPLYCVKSKIRNITLNESRKSVGVEMFFFMLLCSNSNLAFYFIPTMTQLGFIFYVNRLIVLL